MRQVIARSIKKIKRADALVPKLLMLSDEKSLFGSDLYIAVSKEVPDAETTKMSGTFLSKVFEGSYKNMKKWIEEMNEYVKSKGKEVKEMYFSTPLVPNVSSFTAKITL